MDGWVNDGTGLPGRRYSDDIDAPDSMYLTFPRAEWAALRASTPMTLSDDDVAKLRGINVALTRDEVERAYLPLVRLLDLHVQASPQRSLVIDAFLGLPAAPVPYLIAVAGSVAAGKSTLARLLVELLSRSPLHPRVELVTTDGFLHPNAELQRRGLMDRKGFPESYDQRRLLRFVEQLKSGVRTVSAPVYSHSRYDIVAGRHQTVTAADIVVLEGLNVLQARARGPAVSDHLDFAIFVDAAVEDLARWYVERFHTFRRTSFRDPDSYFRHYADLSDAEADAEARRLWHTINEVNLREHILPTRERATLILRKGPDHAVSEVRLRRR